MAKNQENQERVNGIPEDGSDSNPELADNAQPEQPKKKKTVKNITLTVISSSDNSVIMILKFSGLKMAKDIREQLKSQFPNVELTKVTKID